MGQANNFSTPGTKRARQGTAERAAGTGDADAAVLIGRWCELVHPSSLRHPSNGSSARCVLSDDALQVLFAPYCGGLARSEALLHALRLLQGQKLEGCRPVAGADGHGFVLSWSDERAPLDVIHCQLFFPTQPDASRKFSLPTHQLVSWLMDCSASVGEKPDLPDAFWSWVLVEQNDAVADA